MTQPLFKKILIANRGEIAVRIIKTCKKMGIPTVAIYTDADKNAPHVSLADEAVNIGEAHVSETYLNQEKILKVAIESGADAVHPGYGLLSENAEFARRLSDLGVTFIGPSPETMVLMGDKLKAREVAMAANVPVVPGSEGPIADDDEAIRCVEKIGYPVLVKASSGGGGIGMQPASNEKKLLKALAACKRRGQSSFGDDTVYLERLIEAPRHIEVQILADHEGNTIHLFERECSIQRRHQKVIEEAPSPTVDRFPKLREKMTQAAIALAREVNYFNAGTIEFIVGPSGDFYFIEMNTRLQVEHPVTEAITHLDLVEQQIRIAAKLPLSLQQEDIALDGHAIECRIYAENPYKSFMPSPGLIENYQEPTGEGIRVDSGVTAQYHVTPYYDPMIAKLSTHAQTREEARKRMLQALEQFELTGLTTNLALHTQILNDQAFIEADTDTAWLEQFVKTL